GIIQSESMNQIEFDDVYKKLKRHNKPRVVIVFALSSDLKGVLDAIKRANGSNGFIWVVSDGVYNIDDIISQMVGTVKIYLYAQPIHAIDTYIKSLTLADFSKENSLAGIKWIRDAWANHFDCSFSASNANTTVCSEHLTLKDTKGYSPFGDKGSLLMNIINTFAHGLHELITNECPSAFNDKTLLDDCIEGPIFKQYLINVNFTGSWGRVRFDEFGDILGRYSISQVQLDTDQNFKIVNVGIWDVQNEVNLNINNTKLKWHHHKDHNKLQDVFPESLCSYPCQPGEFYIKQELKCCWECRTCRTNEITTNNASTCKECPKYQWPDQETFKNCLAIPLDYLRFTDSLAIVISALSILGFSLCIMTSVVLIKNRTHKLVKASNKELTSLILLGTMLAYLNVFVIIAKPGNVYCYLSCLGFHISSALAYAPMVLKTNRVFRIFDGGKRMIQPKFISSRWQIIMTILLILIQIVISTCVTTILPPVAVKNQPVITEKSVELLCWIPIESLVVPLVFNLVLIIVCAYYGFKTRLLPDNFNESKCIFFSISTTLFMWIAFLPTYFTASSGHNKATLLSALLILNAYVTLFVQFLPKLYAIYYIDEDHMKLTPARLTNSIQPSTAPDA
ncbi:unnamed protein product, partial [Owenia fusiformis]